MEKVAGYAVSSGLKPEDLTFSPVTGAKGNIEYLMYLKKDSATDFEEKEERGTLDESRIDQIVNTSHEELE